jgi:CRISPR-associated protein Cmr3
MSTDAELNLLIRPLDTLMFRDGRPFNQGDPGASDAVSVFPPFPPTVVGMVRALLARRMGRDGGPWNERIKAALGDGADWQSETETALGPLTFAGAVVCRRGRDGKSFAPLYPAPRSILVADKTAEKTYVRLVPDAECLACDLGEVRLPAPEGKHDGLKELGRTWMTREGLQAVLAGDRPSEEHCVPEDYLWRREPRVGVGIDMAGLGSDGLPVSKLAERRPVDGALYAAAHTRLLDNVALAVCVRTSDSQGLSMSGKQLGAAGGEHRMAEFERLDPGHAPKPPARPAQLKRAGGMVRYVVYHASPCLISPLPKAGAALDPAVPGSVVSACLGKALTIGGWDSSQDRRGRPIPMRPAIPAGSVWFLEAPEAAEADIRRLHGGAIGRARSWGFGQVFIGTW